MVLRLIPELARLQKLVYQMFVYNFLIISPDPDVYSALMLFLDLKGHAVHQIVTVEHWPDENVDLCVLDMPIWDDEEIAYVKKSLKKAMKKNVPVVLILPRGHEKPPTGTNPSAVLTRPFEFVSMVDFLENHTITPKNISKVRKDSHQQF